MSLARLALIVSAAFGIAASAQPASTIPSIGIASPDGRILVNVTVAAGAATYAVSYGGQEILRKSRLGVVRDDADFSQGLDATTNYLARVNKLEKVEDRYELLTSKRRQNVYRANRRVLELANQSGARMDVEFQVSNDGFAFRYVFPGADAKIHKISRETSSFNFLAGTRGWLQPIAAPRSGWNESNPSYEEYYERDIPVGQPALLGGAWVFPALFRSGDTWLLLSETGLRRNYCGSRLLAARRSSEYFIDFPGPLETSNGGAVTPESTLPWITPWRLVVIGSLKTIAESTLGTDLADPPARGTKLLPALPGKAAWSWPLLGDDQTVVKVQKQFIDYAADMGWQYTLVDSAWDRQIGYDGLKELVAYGKPKGVRILIWYNSAGEWNTTPLTPRDKMLPATRLAEFQKIKEIGIAGVKVDFFAGDAQSTIAYYHDILEDAARVGLAVNFHGATLPRGWQRTYPNLMTMEAVRGMEYNTFEQENAERGPTHDAMLPFTRNVFDPMDYTPVVLDKLPRTQLRDSAAFELATAVLLTSGIQHYAEIPSGMGKAPPYVREFLKQVPAIWDDVKFIDGFPGQYVVIARRAGRTWYVAGINAETQPRKIKLDLKELGVTKQGVIITNGIDPLGFKSEPFPLEKGVTTDEITMRPRGGFVVTFE
ncbi:MAG TPA: glycoside hydrolase family 97 catalytic domain-containing protein [Steroidobacteraceae bacterium]|nr:glycoside hydrolase family 97 catalytic domain-containing protein [Steroidobacteraceae bacterium]